MRKRRRIFSCPICDLVFAHEDQALQHIVTAHDQPFFERLGPWHDSKLLAPEEGERLPRFFRKN